MSASDLEGLHVADDSFRLKVTLEGGEVHVSASRAALKDLAETCLALSALSDEDAKTAANHVHYADYMNSADDGSIPMMICLMIEK